MFAPISQSGLLCAPQLSRIKHNNPSKSYWMLLDLSIFDSISRKYLINRVDVLPLSNLKGQGKDQKEDNYIARHGENISVKEGLVTQLSYP